MNVQSCNDGACADSTNDHLSSIMFPTSGGQKQWSDEDQDGKGRITNITAVSCRPSIPIQYTRGRSTNFLHKFTVERCDGSRCTNSTGAPSTSSMVRSICRRENTNSASVVIVNEFHHQKLSY